MTISTAFFYDRSASQLLGLNAHADTLQTQISTGKRLQSASDDVVAYQRLAGLKVGTANDGAYSANLTLAGTFLAQTDSTLDSVTSQLQRASELAIQARNGTLSDSDRQAIATELDGIVETLTALGNTKDATGQPLFGGQSSADPVTVNPDGTHSFSTSQSIAIPIGDGQTVQASDSASRVFVGASGKNSIDVVAGLSATLKAGGAIGPAVSTAIDDLTVASQQTASVRGSVGARASRVELETGRIKDVAVDREAVRSGLEDTDMPTAITELQKTLTILSATQASFTKLSGLSLFDYLR